MTDQSKKSLITITHGEEADRSAILELARLDHSESIFHKLLFSEKKFSKMFDDYISNPSRYIGLKAVVNNRIAGFVYCSLGEYFVAEGGLIASVHVVYVNHEFRSTLLGGKIALRLVRAILKVAKARGAFMVMFHVTSGTNIARTDTFFRKMGAMTLGGNYGVRV